MKTFRQFREDVEDAIFNQVLEAKGFGDTAERRRKSKKKKYLSLRSQKLQDLRNRPTSWQGLK